MQTYFDLINFILLSFSILSLGALAGLMAERTGIVNIAIEGQMTTGALLFAICGLLKLNIFLAYSIAVIAGILISLVHGFMTIKMKSSHIISGLAINLLVSGFGPFVIKMASKGRGFLLTGYSQSRFAISGILSAFNTYFVFSAIILLIA